MAENEIYGLVLFRVERVKLSLVAAQVRDYVHQGVVVSKHNRRKFFFEVRGYKRAKFLALVCTIKNARVHSVSLIRSSEFAVMVSHPARNVPWVLGNQREFARLNVAPVDVKDFGIPVVQPD